MSATVSTPAQGRWLAVLLRGQPHQVIYNRGAPYLLRWFVVPRNRLCNIYLHRFVASDDPTLHNHPWWFASVVLRGSYTEMLPNGVMVRRRGSLAVRRPDHRHSVRLHRDARGREISCTTVVVTGPHIRGWGFWCPGERFVGWQEFGPGGCGEDSSAEQTNDHTVKEASLNGFDSAAV